VKLHRQAMKEYLSIRIFMSKMSWTAKPIGMRGSDRIEGILETA
jgi:hypothetical protein